MGGTSTRRPDESVYDWKRRLRKRIDPHQLVGLLCDAAQPARSRATVDAKRDADLIRWSRIPLPRKGRFARNAAFAAFLFIILLASQCSLTPSPTTPSNPTGAAESSP